MNPAFWAIVLLAIGLALFFAEVFIPSGGMILASAVLCVVLSVWSAHTAWWGTNQALFLGFVGVALLLIPITLFCAISLWPRTTLGRRAEPPTLEEVTPYLEEQRRLEQLIGQEGVADTPLNPGGILRIREKRIHCRTEGMIVMKGRRVTVLAVAGNGLLVREVSVDDESTSESGSVADERAPKKKPADSLDFDLPDT